MASKSETGHPINVANFELLITDVASYNGQYNPSKSSLTVDSLRSLLTEVRNSMSAVSTLEPAYKLAVSEREAAYASLSPLSTRIINALKVTDATPQMVDSAQTLIRKLQGRRATPKLSEEDKKLLESEGDTTKQVSASQMSYDNRVENLDKLVQYLSSIPSYNPNEADLKTDSLNNYLSQLKDKNTAVINAEIPLSNARIKRNEIMYADNSGMVAVASDVKTYIKSVFGATSPQYKQISKIKFSSPR